MAKKNKALLLTLLKKNPPETGGLFFALPRLKQRKEIPGSKFIKEYLNRHFQ